jgi:2-keto-3-deoxy-L-rhamnonate aldolase RhmA
MTPPPITPTPWASPVKQKLREGLPVFAATVTVPSADVAAHLATAGFDFLWVEMEHSPVTLESLRNIVLATRGLPAQVFARVPVNEMWAAKRVLDAGVSGVIFPFTSTPDLARQAVSACRYPPHGRRGSGANLAKFAWPDADRYHDSADENVTVITIIEEASAVEQIDEIAATPGIDVLFIGTSDLSFSLGLRGDQKDPRLQEAIQKVLDAGARHGKFVGRPAANPDQVKQYVEQGFRLFQTLTDIGLMMAGAKRYLDGDAALPNKIY